MENVCALADEMCYITKPQKLIKNIQLGKVIDCIDYKNILKILKHLTFNNAKILFSAKKLIQK